jgi:predicted ATP-binding protein involved in virulence
VVIDEPELSISEPWQRRFLQDLKDTGKCSGLIAVTHSPFVFENSLAEYAHSISEFIEEI